MPQMGESIAEGTIVRWIKKVGDKVDRDEPLFEISTDKVDAEIPSPAAGVVSEIRVKEGETVPVNSVVAVIADAGSKAAAPAAAPTKAVDPPKAAPQAGWIVRLRRRSRPTALGRRRYPRTPRRTFAASSRRPPLPLVRARRLAAHRRAGRRHEPRAQDRPVDGPASTTEEAIRRAVVAARAQDRQGAQRRHLADPRHRHRRPRDEGRHPGVHRAGRRKGGKAGRRQARQAGAADRAAARQDEAPYQARRFRRRRSSSPAPPITSRRCRRCGSASPSTWSSAGARRRTCTRSSR